MKHVLWFSFLFAALVDGTQAQLFKRSQEPQQLLVSGFAQGPALSPDGRYLAFSKEGYNGVFVLNLETNKVDELCRHLGAGWGMQWLDHRQLIVRATRDAANSRERSMGVEVIDVESKKETVVIPFARQNRIEVPQRNAAGKMILRNRKTITVLDASTVPKMRSVRKIDEAGTMDGQKILTGTKALPAPGGRTILSLVWSPDGARALVELMGRPSLYLFDKLIGTFQLLAEMGERPSWANNDVYVYMETMDDGHTIVKGDIYIASLKSGTRENLSAALGKIALNPTVSPDGKIAFNTLQGELYLLRVQLP